MTPAARPRTPTAAIQPDDVIDIHVHIGDPVLYLPQARTDRFGGGGGEKDDHRRAATGSGSGAAGGAYCSSTAGARRPGGSGTGIRSPESGSLRERFG